MNGPEWEKESTTPTARDLDYLALRGIFHYRNNSGGFKDANQHFYQFGAVGSPDIVAVINGRYVAIEVKGTNGRQSDHQKEFQRKLELAGGTYILAFSLTDVVIAIQLLN